MKSKFSLVLVALLFLVQTSSAQELKTFLKGCAWGTAAGATAGVISLAFTDKPSGSWNNVAKGASLGLYAGIGYGLYHKKSGDSDSSQSELAIIPEFKENKLEGFQVVGRILSF